MRKENLAVEWVSLARLFLSPTNPRHNDEAIEPVSASLRRFGWRQPLVAKPSGEVIAGNTRLKAATRLGFTEVPVVWFEGSDLDATAYQIADNKTHEYASWNNAVLAQLLQELRAEDSLSGVGFDASAIDELLAELAQSQTSPPVLDDPGPGEVPTSPIALRGDVWLLGDHRLLCGDSTSAEDVARLLQGERVALLSTDPPYCVNYTGKDRPIHDGKPSGKDWTHVYREVDIKDLGVFLDGVFQATLPHLEEASAIYMWHAHVQQPTIAAAFQRHGLLLHQVLVWVKPCAVFGHSYYRWRHEPCAFGWRQGSKPQHGIGQLDTVWEADWEGKARFSCFHPTSKPTRLFEIPIQQHTKVGDLVLEPFSGSGSQIIAAEKLGRRCRAMELQPAFVDGTIERWQKATGKEARLEASGETFAAVTRQRKAT
ncbi:MAG: DNA modification methylase [Planctomycetes bacterium]|nr:DNA modification methylase [Planctomycetota bacterium]